MVEFCQPALDPFPSSAAPVDASSPLSTAPPTAALSATCTMLSTLTAALPRPLLGGLPSQGGLPRTSHIATTAEPSTTLRAAAVAACTTCLPAKPADRSRYRQTRSSIKASLYKPLRKESSKPACQIHQQLMTRARNRKAACRSAPPCYSRPLLPAPSPLPPDPPSPSLLCTAVCRDGARMMQRVGRGRTHAYSPEESRVSDRGLPRANLVLRRRAPRADHEGNRPQSWLWRQRAKRVVRGVRAD